ncbi:DHH family phosphoesterase [Youxingia wuxianensis]|nr:DHH family phosphoesterase [Youxingia wuxianensis]
MKKNRNLIRPLLYVFVASMAIMTLLSLYYSLQLFYIAAGITVVGIIVSLLLMRRIKKYINSFLVHMGQSLTTVQQDALIDFPIPVFVVDRDGEILWYNQKASGSVLEGENFYSKNINTILAGVNVTRRCPDAGYETEYKNRQFVAYVSAAAGEHDQLYIVYFFENTELKKYAREYFETRPSIMLMLVDNYEELSQSLKDNERSRVMGQIEYLVNKFVTESGGLVVKTERDRFVVIIEEKNLRGIISSRFPILEQIRTIEGDGKMAATLSIGVGRDADTLGESEQFARQALDMALGRGGDQAVVRSASGYEFFGGVSKGVEKRTKVKTRIVATALAELIGGSDNVIIMGHHLADLDCFGASIGVLKAVREMGKEAVIAIRREKNLVMPLLERLEENGYSGLFVEPEAAMQMVTKKSLLIILDTHIKQFLESEQLYDMVKSVVVIDHHRKMVGHIDNAVIFYHEPYASSASEMVTELIQYFGDKYRIERMEAEALLAGIMLDTKNFVIKTGVRTFEAAAYLRKIGADTVEVKRLFATPMTSYQLKTRLVANAKVYKGCAIASSSDHMGDIQIIAAQAADELLNISGVKASFLIFEMDGGVSYSARSMGVLNVQLIMEKLGGGGHHTMAGAQIKGITLEEAHARLMGAIDEYFAENNRQ